MKGQVYLVGGAVRDALLGIEVYDRDWVVVGSTAEEMLQQGYEQVGKDFPVFLHPQSKEEYALARTERKQGEGYHGFSVFADPSVTLEEDLIRRDLTINAMAQDTQGEIVDAYGGLEDLRNKTLRHVSDAFVEDPLRVLRVARFAAKLAEDGFTVHESTLALMSKMAASGELSALTPERVWQEVVKALNTNTPSVFFEVLKSVGALQVLFPEIDGLYRVPQSPKHHPEGDVGVHTMMVLDAAAKLTDRLEIRFAALVHDLGKGQTPEAIWPRHTGHEALGVPLVKGLCERYRVPKKVQQLAEKVTLWHGVIHQGGELQNGVPKLTAEQVFECLQACQAFKSLETLQAVLLACEADSKGRLGFEAVEYPQVDFWLAVASVANNVDQQAIIKQGFQGKEIGEQIAKQRLEYIRNAMHGNIS